MLAAIVGNQDNIGTFFCSYEYFDPVYTVWINLSGLICVYTVPHKAAQMLSSCPPVYTMPDNSSHVT